MAKKSSYMVKLGTIVLILSSFFGTASAQIEKIGSVKMDYENPTSYVIGGISTSITTTVDRNILVILSGLQPYQRIKVPGDDISRAIEKLWKQGIFSDVEIETTGTKEDTIYLRINVIELPKLSKYSIKGLGKQETKNIREEISLRRGLVVNENLVSSTKREIQTYFRGKGYYNVKVDIKREVDTSMFNSQMLRIHIKQGKKVKVEEYVFVGNDNLEAKKIRRFIKPKQKKGKILFFMSSKLVEADFRTEIDKIGDKYRSLGYRDAEVKYDSIIRIHDNRVLIKIGIAEGEKYYFRHIDWVGNTLYSSGKLDTLLGITKGDIFNQAKLESKLFMDPNGFDISSLYMDNGYLFFNIIPVETRVDGDSIDLEIRIYEGKQATISSVTVSGNDKTSDFVILRALRTKPGQKFSRTDIQRSMRELAALNYFDPESLDVNPIPNPASGTVDIEYKVAEKPSDQIEASGGFGGGFGFVGSVGLSLNNFSSRKMLKRSGWDPIPSGDGQRLTLRAQSNGRQFQSYNFSFTEPWLGGKKPNSLTTSVYHSVQSNIWSERSDPLRPFMKTTGATVVFGKLLKVPDDFFTWSNALNYQRYSLNNWNNFGASEIGFTDGKANSFSWNTVLSRNSTNAPIFPMSGSTFSFSFQATLPHSAFNKDADYSTMSSQEKFKWIEYHKWKINMSWYQETLKKLILVPHFEAGIIGLYNKEVGYSPFEQFRVGGSGFGSWAVYGTEIIPQKGYDSDEISQDRAGDQDADPLYSKFSLELRYPFSNNPNASISGYTYFEAGNTWNRVRDYNPFDLRRAAGLGLRMYLPMFGMLQFDYGWGFDKTIPQKGQLLFSIGQTF
ncbi:MAG: outer membrane protein insertion porin family [Bacteroidia bacterium]|jgi:outer membrane protein insertion porin family